MKKGEDNLLEENPPKKVTAVSTHPGYRPRRGEKKPLVIQKEDQGPEKE